MPIIIIAFPSTWCMSLERASQVCVHKRSTHAVNFVVTRPKWTFWMGLPVSTFLAPWLSKEAACSSTRATFQKHVNFVSCFNSCSVALVPRKSQAITLNMGLIFVCLIMKSINWLIFSPFHLVNQHSDCNSCKQWQVEGGFCIKSGEFSLWFFSSAWTISVFIMFLPWWWFSWNVLFFSLISVFDGGTLVSSSPLTTIKYRQVPKIKDSIANHFRTRQVKSKLVTPLPPSSTTAATQSTTSWQEDCVCQFCGINSENGYKQIVCHQKNEGNESSFFSKIPKEIEVRKKVSFSWRFTVSTSPDDHHQCSAWQTK